MGLSAATLLRSQCSDMLQGIPGELVGSREAAEAWSTGYRSLENDRRLFAIVSCMTPTGAWPAAGESPVMR